MSLGVVGRLGDTGLGQLNCAGDLLAEFGIQLWWRFSQVHPGPAQGAKVVIHSDGTALKQDSLP